MSWAELHSRWQNVRNRDDAIQYISDRQLRLTFKTPSDVVKSIIKKRWLSDAGLEGNYWPYKMIDGIKAPHLVEDSMVSAWAKMNEATRACYLWRRDAEFAMQARDSGLGKRLYILSYEELRKDPGRIMEEIANFLSTKTTDLTRLGTMSVRPMSDNRESGETNDFLSDVDANELRKFNELNAVWGYH